MKILLIEYEPRYLERIRGYLAGKDYELVVARDGDEGLDLYRRARPDLVLISSVLPRLRTPEVIKAMQSSGATPPILLMMSGYKGRNKRADAQRVGATSILEKPFGEEIFMAEIQAALGLRPALDLPPASGASESAEPLLSADDIFSEILSGIDEGQEPPAAPIRPPAAVAPPAPAAAPPAAPIRPPAAVAPPAPAAAPPAIDPAMQKRLETTLSGLMPQKKTETPAGFVPTKTSGEAPAPVETIKVNLAELSPAARPPEKPKSATHSSASVDQLLKDTLSGLKIKPRTGSASGLSDPGLAAPEKPVAASPPPAAAPTVPTAPAPPTPPSQPRPERFGAFVSRETPAPLPEAVSAPFPTPRPAPRPAPALSPPPPGPGVNTLATPAATPAAASVAAPVPSRVARPPSGPGAFGRYQLLERIASGGMADVFKARMSGEEGFEKIVAIKRILPHLATNEGFITMFVDEAKLAAQLSHNNIIHIYELGKVDAWHYIAMEYVDGKDLRSILKMGRDRAYPLPVELSLFVASRIANALDYAHRRVAPDGTDLNLVHRDVSPQNILISWEGDIKLCDFGVAKAATKVSTTMSGALKGKLQYMSPEQAWGKKIDRRSDIFSLGAVLFEMLTGRPLFEGENDMTILEKVRDGQVEPPSARNPEVPRRIDQIVLKALAKNAHDRYQNASEFEKDLVSVLYSYQPSPGPADLAIHVHRLLETPPSTSDDDIDAAFAAAQQPLEVTPSRKKGKGLVLSRGSSAERPALSPPSLPAAPAAETRPTPVVTRPEPVRPLPAAEAKAAIPAGGESAKSRAGLFAGIGLAAVVLIAGGIWFAVGRGRSTAPPVPSPEAAPTVATAPVSEPPSTAAEAAKVVDQKAVEAEAKRLAAEAERARRDTAKAAAQAKTVPPPATGSPALSLAAKAPLEPPRPAEVVTAVAIPAPPVVPTAEPAAAKAPAIEPTRPAPAEVSVTQAPPAVSPAVAPAVPPAVPPAVDGKPNVGDLVGPGEGVVEPKLVRMGAFTGLPGQARQLARTSPDQSLGTTVLFGLVDENGKVTEVRILRPSPHKFADEAAIRALRNATITPATKDGVKVKMWSTFAVTVKP